METKRTGKTQVFFFFLKHMHVDDSFVEVGEVRIVLFFGCGFILVPTASHKQFILKKPWAKKAGDTIAIQLFSFHELQDHQADLLLVILYSNMQCVLVASHTASFEDVTIVLFSI